MEMGRLRDAERLLAAALEAKRRSGAGPVECGRTLYNLAETALDAGELTLAAERALTATGELRSGGYHRLAAAAASVRAMALWRLGDVGPAIAAADLANDLATSAGASGEDRRTAALVGLRRSVLLHATRQSAAALEMARRAVALGLSGAKRDWEEVASALEAHAALLAPGHPDAAAAVLGAAAGLRRQVPRPVGRAAADLNRDTADTCRARLGAAAFDLAFRRGERTDRGAIGDLLQAIINPTH
jgi:hypothetical protein